MNAVSPTSVISVRGDSNRWVDPDSAVIGAGINLVRDDQHAALADASAALDSVLAGVTRLGATALTAETRRAPLTYSAQSVSTHDEYATDERSGGYGPTGRVSASVGLEFTVRDLDRLDELHAELGRHPTLRIHGVTWSVDDDNPAWQQCRTEAVYAALARARDYASALGGRIVHVVELADTGLIDSAPRFALRARAAAGGGAAHDEAPSLTPVPQQVSAAVEARVLAEVPPLT